MNVGAHGFPTSRGPIVHGGAIATAGHAHGEIVAEAWAVIAYVKA